MSTSPFDSGPYRELLHDDEIGDLFSDAAVIISMMQVEGALAKAQGKLGVIPKASARAISGHEFCSRLGLPWFQP